METSDTNFDEICRTCMDGGRLLPIFGEVIYEGDAETTRDDYSSSIMEYAGIQISKEDGLPQSMCYGCLHLLKSAIYFRKISQRSYQRLAELVSGSTTASMPVPPTRVDVEGNFSHVFHADYSHPTSDTTDTTSSSDDTVTESLLYPSKLHYSEKEKCNSRTNRLNHSQQLNESENSHSYLSENDMASEITENLSTSKKRMKPGKALQELVLAKAKTRRQRDNREGELAMISEKMNGVVERKKKMVEGRKKRASKVGDLEETGKDSDRKSGVEDSGSSGIRSIFKLVSSSERTVRCSLCNVVLKRASMHNHAQKHLGYKFICELCGKGFVSKFGLEQHYMTRHGKLKSLACEQCDYRTGSRFELSVHARSHSGERPFTCDVCGKGFHRRRCMINHVALHSDYRPYECMECEKRFVCSSTLATHRAAAHAPRVRHPCSACGAAYARPAALRRHLRSAHSASSLSRSVGSKNLN